MILDERPLAERMRPKHSSEVVGQDHLLSKDAVFGRFLITKQLPSIILWGPPGVGKTTLASLLAKEIDRPFYKLSAINSGVKDIREVVNKAKNEGLFNAGRPILFIDEIHRFSKSQQDSLLEAVEKGSITLVGATTENPSFEVISALLSRCQVYILKALTEESMVSLLMTAIETDSILSKRKIDLKETAMLIRISGGDGRKLLNALELVVQMVSDEAIVITDELVKEVISANLSTYDKQGEQHYDIASALIKSIRGSDPQAAVYWLARMIEGGEDPKFIARRLLISASEDIGLANPNALLIADSCFSAVAKIGWPESRIILSQCAIYLATSAKSNSAYAAIGLAQELVRKEGDLPVPLALRNAPTKLMKDLGYGKEYQYAHNGEGNFVDQAYLPDSIDGTLFYQPGENAKENDVKRRLSVLWNKRYKY